MGEEREKGTWQRERERETDIRVGVRAKRDKYQNLRQKIIFYV